MCSPKCQTWQKPLVYSLYTLGFPEMLNVLSPFAAGKKSNFMFTKVASTNLLSDEKIIFQNALHIS